MRAARPLSAVLLSLAGSLTAAAAPPAVPASEQAAAGAPTAATDAVIPYPDTAAMDDAVRRQLETTRRTLDQNLAAGGSGEELLEAVSGVCRLYVAYDFLKAAVPCLELARRLDPRSAEWPYLTGYLRERQGRTEQAIGALETAAALESGAGAPRLRLGNLHLEQNRPEKAREWFDRALAADPSCVAARFGLGEVARRAGDDEAAVTHYRAVLATLPRSTQAHYSLGLALRRLGRRDEALAELRQVDLRQTTLRPWWGCADPWVSELGRLATGASAHLLRGLEASFGGNTATEIAEYRRAVELDPADAVARKSLGTALYAEGDLAGAEEQIRQAVRLAPDDPGYRFDLGQVRLRRGDIAEAREMFLRCVDLDPTFERAHERLASLALDVGDRVEAEEHLRRLVDLDPLNGWARAGLAKLELEAGQRQEAVIQLGRLLDDRPPSDPGERLRLASMLAVLGDTERAEAHYRAVLELGAAPPVLARAHAMLGQLRLDQGRPQEALEELQAAVDLDPASAEAEALLDEAKRRAGP